MNVIQCLFDSWPNISLTTGLNKVRRWSPFTGGNSLSLTWPLIDFPVNCACCEKWLQKLQLKSTNRSGAQNNVRQANHNQASVWITSISATTINQCYVWVFPANKAVIAKLNNKFIIFWEKKPELRCANGIMSLYCWISINSIACLYKQFVFLLVYRIHV